MYIYSNTAAKLLFVKTEKAFDSYRILNKDGKEIACALMGTKKVDDGFLTTLDAENLELWSVDSPVLYTFEANGEAQRFGHMSLKTFQNKQVLLNDAPIYLRGHIRGITAHEHPNMTGLSNYEAAIKNIRQAKKYGFNLVRFHSTVPSEDFMRAADELGFLVHMEIGFAYDYDSEGHKKNLSMNNEKWVEVITKYRNHPSLAICCIGNEMHNSGRYPQVHALYKLGKELAPNKLFIDNSGWGEYDRSSADLYAQHIAYFFPYAHHADMFDVDTPWLFNGSTYEVPFETQASGKGADAKAVRKVTPIRPTISHEAIHYIDIPDYAAMNAKFDAFAEKVGEEYLKQHEIKKPKYLTELPKLIERKGLGSYMDDYYRCSKAFKELGMKVFWERLRLSSLCGYEMLQFADCFKYENKNGLVDFFDDDKGYDPEWVKKSNSDLVLLCDMKAPYCYEGETVALEVYASDFLPKAEIIGTLTVKFGDEVIYKGENFVLAGGLQKLVSLEVTAKKVGATEITAQFASGGGCADNAWKFWVYPKQEVKAAPETNLKDGALKELLSKGSEKSELYVTDALNAELFEKLENGQTAILLYEHLSERNTWQMQGALERFKPCIWDRGSNLGGVIKNKKVLDAAQNELFDLNMQPLLEAGYKVNLDDVPFAVSEHVIGADKPVRDRMKGLVAKIKDFLDTDTLRKFSHLFSVKIGKGQLIVCTFNLNDVANPVVANLIKVLFDSPEALYSDKEISKDEFIAYLEKTNAEGIRKEDVMNHFWEIDNKLVEDTLFWEEAQVDLSKMEESGK